MPNGWKPGQRWGHISCDRIGVACSLGVSHASRLSRWRAVARMFAGELFDVPASPDRPRSDLAFPVAACQRFLATAANTAGARCPLGRHMWLACPDHRDPAGRRVSHAGPVHGHAARRPGLGLFLVQRRVADAGRSAGPVRRLLYVPQGTVGVASRLVRRTGPGGLRFGDQPDAAPRFRRRTRQAEAVSRRARSGSSRNRQNLRERGSGRRSEPRIHRARHERQPEQGRRALEDQSRRTERSVPRHDGHDRAWAVRGRSSLVPRQLRRSGEPGDVRYADERPERGVGTGERKRLDADGVLLRIVRASLPAVLLRAERQRRRRAAMGACRRPTHSGQPGGRLAADACVPRRRRRARGFLGYGSELAPPVPDDHARLQPVFGFRRLVDVGQHDRGPAFAIPHRLAVAHDRAAVADFDGNASPARDH